MSAHNPDVCFCGPDTGMECGCPCDECMRQKTKIAWNERLVGLEDRLKKAGIDPRELAGVITHYLFPVDQAEVVWRLLEEDLERKVEKITKAVLSRCLKEIRLETSVMGAYHNGDDQ